MTLDEAIAIENRKEELIAERNHFHAIVCFDGVVGGDKALLSPEAREAYEQNEIGQAYFDFIEDAERRRDAIQAEINALPRVPMSVALQMRAA